MVPCLLLLPPLLPLTRCSSRRRISGNGSLIARLKRILIMQSANAAAPKLIDALITLGRADLDHVRFSMLGLPSTLQQDAQDAVKCLRRVAARLVSRRLATDLRIEMAALRARSAYPNEVASVDWSSPHAIPIGNGDILQLLLFHSRSAPLGCGGYAGDDDWPVRQDFHYKTALTLAQLNRAWRDSVREWCREDCSVSLLGGDDDDYSKVDSLVRVSGSNMVELQLHGNSAAGGPLALNSWEVRRFVRRCPNVRRLAIRVSDDLDCATLVGILAACPSLEELDLAGSYTGATDVETDAPLEAFFQAAASRPRLRVYATACDDVFVQSRTSLSKANVVAMRCEAADRRGRAGCPHCARIPQSGAIECRFGWPAWSHRAGMAVACG